METITINVGKYRFDIIDETFSLGEQIYSRIFKIGGNDLDCVHISIRYDKNQPVSAHINFGEFHLCTIKTPTLSAVMSEQGGADCAFEIRNGVHVCISDVLLERKKYITMVKTLLSVFHIKIPTITELSFDDHSNIECTTNVYPVSLYYFSIAFNGETWYENIFNARQKDVNKHTEYKEKINKLLYLEEEKTNTHFIRFLQISCPPGELFDELEKYYIVSKTFGDFFTSIPEIDRCRLVGDWISNFMRYFLEEVFSYNDWIIELPAVSTYNIQKYYCPDYQIFHNTTYYGLGVSVLDV